MSESKPASRDPLWNVTAPAIQRLTGADAETQAAREGYVTLGKLLDRAADEGFDEKAFLGKLAATVEKNTLAAALAPTIALPQVRSRSTVAPWAVGLAAIAAAVLLLFVGNRLWRGTTLRNDREVVQPQSPVAPGTTPNNSSAFVAWSDPLDDQLAAAGTQVSAVRGEMLETRYWSLQEQIREMASDLEASPL